MNERFLPFAPSTSSLNVRNTQSHRASTTVLETENWRIRDSYAANKRQIIDKTISKHTEYQFKLVQAPKSKWKCARSEAIAFDQFGDEAENYDGSNLETQNGDDKGWKDTDTPERN